MANVGRAFLINTLARSCNLTRSETKDVIDGLLGLITEQLAAGNHVELRRFGVFSPTVRKPRVARDPSRGKPLPVGTKTTVTFRPTPTLKAAVKDVKPGPRYALKADNG